jgi:dipeptidyl aminopeptidase/acylaminoacyl peptidase
VRWISKDDEAHGFGKLANNVDLYNQVLDFLEQNIGSAKPAN